MIGGELEIKKIKHLGKIIVGITVVQVLGTTLVVFIAMFYFLKLPLTISLLLGVMATATAPAATLAVIREYRARGNLTTTLLGVVALDDAVAIIFFGIVSAVVALLLQGGGIGLGSIVFSLAEVFKSSCLRTHRCAHLSFPLPAQSQAQSSRVDGSCCQQRRGLRPSIYRR